MTLERADRGRASARPLAFFAMVRAEQWWSSKLIPPLAIVYATCVLNDQAIVSVWPDLLLLIVGLAAGAAGVSVVNDLADRGDDRLAGKRNRMARGVGMAPLLMLTVSAAGVLLVVWARWNDPLSMAVYLGCWAAFLCYSLPPLRLKARGFWGVAADAGGAHLLPALFAILLVAAPGSAGREWTWLLSVCTWSFMLGIRGIVGHQLADKDADQRAGTRTFVVATSPDFATRLITVTLFPVECVSLLLILVQLDSPSAWVALAVYPLLLTAKTFLFHMRPSVFAVKARAIPLLQDFYLVLLPLALLADAAAGNSGDGIILVAHLVIFAPVIVVLIIDLGRLAWRVECARRWGWKPEPDDSVPQAVPLDR